MSSHVPDKGEQMVRYYGYYSNVSRGKRKKQNQDEWIPCILEPEGSSKEYRKNWTRLIQKIYEINPLTCPKCQGKMKMPSSSISIDDSDSHVPFSASSFYMDPEYPMESYRISKLRGVIPMVAILLRLWGS
jgi:hypothetical protein